MSWRYCFYQKGNIHLWTWDEKGKRIYKTYPFKPFVFIEHPEGKDGISIFQTPLKKLEFSTNLERQQFLERHRSTRRFFHNLPPSQQFLIEFYQDKPLFQTHEKVKIFFMDIEVLSESEFPTAAEAKYPICLLTIYDNETNTFYCWGLKNDFQVPSNSNIQYFCCSDERKLLQDFLEFWSANPPDIVSGWNVLAFDIAYLIRRITRLFSEKVALFLSPLQIIFSRTAYTKRSQQFNKNTIVGISILDYMDLYQTFSFGERESYALGYISEYELGEGKTSYRAHSLNDLARKDWSTFVEYNIQDVRLVKKLDDKLKYIQLARTLACMGYCNYDSALGKISILQGALAAHAKYRFQRYLWLQLPQQQQKTESDHLIGAFVREPTRKGFVSHVLNFDVNSLYPSLILTLNISPETKLGQTKSFIVAQQTQRALISDIKTLPSSTLRPITFANEPVEVEWMFPKLQKVFPSRFENFKAFQTFLQEKHLIVSAAGAIYCQNKQGVFPSLIQDLYKQRLEQKQKSKHYKKIIQQIQDQQIRKQYEIKQNDADILNSTLKIVLNSCYGIMSNIYSPFYDLDNALSITLSGQEVARYGGSLLNKIISKRFSLPLEQNYIIYGDTDSIYVSLEEAFKTHPELKTQKRGQIFEELEESINKAINLWAQKYFLAQQSFLSFKQESYSDIGIFLQKKRYILHIIDEEGIATNKYKYVGMEVARSTISSSVKNLIKDIIETALQTQSFHETNNVVCQSYQKFLQLPIEEIAIRISAYNLTKYTQKTQGRFVFGKGTPSHIKAVIAYNTLISENQFSLKQKYEPIFEGEKVRKVYIKQPNIYNLDALAFPTYFPSEFGLEVDRDRMFQTLVVAPIQRFYEVIGWSMDIVNFLISSTTKTQTFFSFLSS